MPPDDLVCKAFSERFSGVCMLKRMSLKWRALLIGLVAGLGLLLALTLLATNVLYQSLEQQVEARQLGSAQSLALRIQDELQQRKQVLEATTALLARQGRLLPVEELNEFLQKPGVLKEVFPDGLLLQDADFTAIAEDIYVPNRLGTNYADRAHNQELLQTGKTVISRPIIGRRTGLPLLVIVSPVMGDEGELLGSLSALINLSKDRLDLSRPENLSGTELSGHEGERYRHHIIDADNRFFVETASQGELIRLPEAGKDPLLDAALRETGLGEVRDQKGVEWFYAAVTIDSLGWVIIEAVEHQAAMQPVFAAMTRFLLYGVVIMLFAGAAGYVVLQWAIQPLDDVTLKIRGLLGESNPAPIDVDGPTEVQAVAVAFNELMSERHELDRLKDNFISTVSHELRTPLTSIAGGLRLLQAQAGAGLEDAPRDMLDIAIRNTDRLQRLINDLLDFNKLVAGKVELKPVEVELSVFLAETVQSFAAQAELRGCHVRYRCSSQVSVRADTLRLRQILDNFLSNALKYSPKDGEVLINVEAGRPGSRLRLTVSDQGPGVSATFAPNVFKPFSQADSGIDRSSVGTGLGLAICKELALLMGGEVGYYNENGAHFWVELPQNRG